MNGFQRALAGLAITALVAGCKQGAGDRCQVNSDCQDTLICVIPAGGSLAEGGTCQPPAAAIDAGTADQIAVPTVDAAVPMVDATSTQDDASTPPDATSPPTDLLPADLLPADLLPADLLPDLTGVIPPDLL